MNRAITADRAGQRAAFPLSLSRLGDVGLAALWTLMSISSIGNTITESDEVGWLSTAHHAVSSTILVLCAVLFIIRRPARSRHASWRSRATAIVGTWMMPILILLPLTWEADWILTVSTLALIGTHIFVCWALATLRRSFSIFPEARALIRSGPYGIVRHPLYATYLGMYVMFLLPRLSVLAVVVTVLGIGCEIWRAHDEEAVLSEAFPDYAEYAAETPRFFPKLLAR